MTMDNTKHDSGGPAFPVQQQTDANDQIIMYAFPGMSMWDHFAAKAMQGIIAGDRDCRFHQDNIVEQAANFADAMITERKKRMGL
jgi:hypothetical protein